MNEASVYMLKQNNGTKEIFSKNFFLSTFESYHPLHENDTNPGSATDVDVNVMLLCKGMCNFADGDVNFSI